MAVKSRIRAEYSRIPWMNWIKINKDPLPVPEQRIKWEKGDVAAMIIAALSLALPWAAAFAAVMGLFIYLLGLIYG